MLKLVEENTGPNFRFCTCKFKEDIGVHKNSKQLGGKIVNEPYILKHASQENYQTKLIL